MTKLCKRMLMLALCGLILLPAGCRSRTQPAPRVQPPVTTDTVGEVAVPPTRIEEPTDFVTPEVRTEELPADIAEASRLAHQRGWIRDVFFGYDEAGLSAEARDALSASASWLRAHPQYNLLVEGHCDERGTEQYNLALGDRRANVVREYLVTLGVDGGRIRTVSYGEERPFAEGHNEAAWSQNRRGHLVLVGR